VSRVTAEQLRDWADGYMAWTETERSAFVIEKLVNLELQDRSEFFRLLRERGFAWAND
jgi:hypothetical protein